MVYAVLGLIALFVAVILVRAAMFEPKPQPPVSQEEVTFDKKAAVENLAKLIRCKTVSYSDHSLEDDGEFRKLLDMLPSLYPNVYERCSVRELPDRGLLLRWPGKETGDPAVLMAQSGRSPPSPPFWKTVFSGAEAPWTPRSLSTPSSPLPIT